MITDKKDFYPTPEWLTKKMLNGIDWNFINTVIDPSAGKGDILDVVQKEFDMNKRYYDNRKLNIDAVEIDDELQHILKGKGYRLVHDDFLTFNTYKHYDLLIANFPFSEGDKHLLKAIEMQEQSGGAIICLVNAETIRNPYSNTRTVLKQKLDDNNASIEYISNAFTDAERKTNVEVALIKVKFEEKKQESFIYESLRKAQEQREFVEQQNTSIIENDIVKSSVLTYQLEVESVVKFIKEYWAMCSHMQKEFKPDGSISNPIIKVELNSYEDKNLTVNGAVKEVRRKYWSALFKNPKFTGKMTENLRNNYLKQVEELSNYDFSEWNIKEIQVDMMRKLNKGIEDCILDLFEELTNKYHYLDETSKNIHLYNGWKTNRCYIVNKKVVLPCMNAYDQWSGKFEPTRYSSQNVLGKLKDIEKCLDYLDGGRTKASDIVQELKFAEDYGQTKDIELKYFKVSFYKKGTAHIVFSNDELLKKFNIFGSQHKGWLPPCYGKKSYKDMTQEEKNVVDDFEGSQSYTKVMADKKYYIVDSNSLLLEEK